MTGDCCYGKQAVRIVVVTDQRSEQSYAFGNYAHTLVFPCHFQHWLFLPPMEWVLRQGHALRVSLVLLTIMCHFNGVFRWGDIGRFRNIFMLAYHARLSCWHSAASRNKWFRNGNLYINNNNHHVSQSRIDTGELSCSRLLRQGFPIGPEQPAESNGFNGWIIRCHFSRA